MREIVIEFFVFFFPHQFTTYMFIREFKLIHEQFFN